MNFEYKFWREVSLQFLNVQVKNLLKYSSLFTYPSQPPINRAFGEVKRSCNSSPLFTTLHHSSPPLSLRSRRDCLICSSNSSRNRRLGNWICRIPPLWVVAETWVKSGEEWWRVGPTLHLVIRPVYRGLRGKGEEWRVFHDSIVYSNLEIKNPWCWSLFSISYCRFYYAVWTANWQIWWQLSVLGKTVSCSGSASLLFYVNS